MGIEKRRLCGSLFFFISDTLTTIRMLKERGIEVYFEEQNIYSLDSKGELLLTIMSSLAQEESRSISENVTWGMRKRFADGKVALPYKQFLGYRKGADGLPEIVPEEAEVVRDIYRMFLEGKSPSYIARSLTAQGIPSPARKKQWRPETVKSILTNEKYKGDAILQKSFCTDFLTKKMKVNEGEVPQYYVENSHPAIIAPEVYEVVQAEMAIRKRPGRRNYTPHCFSGRIYCDECGSLYGSKVWHAKTVWQCNARHKGKTTCKTPALRDETLRDAFVIAINRVIEKKDELLRVCEDTLIKRYDTKELEVERAALQTELSVLNDMMENLITQNATSAMDQAEYNAKFEAFETRFNTTKQQITEIEKHIAELAAKRSKIAGYLALIKAQGPIRYFDERLWLGTVEQVRVLPDGHLRFVFKDGAAIDC